MSRQRESHRQALRQLLALHGLQIIDHEHLINEILRINDRFSGPSSLDEALNAGDGSYKP